uniref:Uncharacterized protein n=1 Tax=Lepeophtheirus salmonis TaxID=72036 RepID=A0A0K2TWT2_LEPSM
MLLKVASFPLHGSSTHFFNSNLECQVYFLMDLGGLLRLFSFTLLVPIWPFWQRPSSYPTFLTF